MYNNEFSQFEKDIIFSYRNQSSSIKEAVDKLLLSNQLVNKETYLISLDDKQIIPVDTSKKTQNQTTNKTKFCIILPIIKNDVLILHCVSTYI